MEKDINILENFIKNFEGRAVECVAIGNLINRNKELEKKNKELYETCCRYEDTLEHYEYKIFDELDAYIKLDEISKLDKIGIKGKKYISEFLIKEKIEEYKTKTDKYEKQMENDEDTDLCYEEVREYACKIQVLEELLKGE